MKHTSASELALHPTAKIILQSEGESEFHIFFDRDRTVANILVTEDTDIFPIVYQYLRESETDHVFVYNRRRHLVFPLNTLSVEEIPRPQFQMLCAMLGTDYTPNILTGASIKLLLGAPKHLDLSRNYCVKTAVSEVAPAAPTDTSGSESVQSAEVDASVVWVYDYFTTLFLRYLCRVVTAAKGAGLVRLKLNRSTTMLTVADDAMVMRQYLTELGLRVSHQPIVASNTRVHSLDRGHE